MDATLYDEHETLEQDHWWFVGRRAIVDRIVRKWVAPGLPADARILDVGCGTGGMLPLLAEFGEVSGVEFEASAVERCHRHFPGFTVRQGTVPADVPNDASFDLVTSFDVIEHIADEAAAVRSLAAATMSGGSVVVTVPAYQWLWSRHDDLNGHQRRYSMRRLRRALTAAGLEVTHLSYFNTALLPVVGGVRAAQRLRARADGAILRPERSAGRAPGSDLTMPGPLANSVLTRVLGAERFLAASSGLPAGVSLVAVARKP